MPAGCRRLALHNDPIIVAASVTLAWTPRPRRCSPRRNRPRSKGTSGTAGTAGTRNFLGILTTVNCSATAARQIANRMRYSGILDDYENVDGVVALTHGRGCGMAPSGEGGGADGGGGRGCVPPISRAFRRPDTGEAGGVGVIVTVTPNPSVDRTYEIPALAVGEINRATRVHQEPSGKGVNVTRALTANSVPSLAVLPCGGPEGDTLMALLEAEKVAYRAVPVAGSVRVNISLTEPGGRATKINEAGASLGGEDLERLTSAALAAAGPGDWIVCSGSLPPGVPPDYYAQAGRQAHAAGLRFALDTSGTALRAGLDAGPDAVKPNADELAEVTGQPIAALGDAIAGARALLARGAGCVVVSMGADGALLVSPDGAWHASAQAPTVRSTVGAGDALLAGFLAAGGVGAGALREAVVWATAAVGAEGSHVPLIDEAVRAAVQVFVAPARR